MKDLNKKNSEKERIIADLLAGTSYSEVYNSTRAKKTFYNALQECVEIHEKRNKKLSTQNETKKALFQKVSLQVEEKEKRKDVLTSENISAETRLKRIRKEIEKHQPDVDAYKKAQNDLSELAEKGIDLGFLVGVCKTDVASREDFLERIETLETYNQVKEDISKLKKQIQNLRDEEEQIKQNIKTHKQTLADLIKKSETEKLILNDLELRTRTHENAMKVVTAFFLEGYTTEDLESLREGINLVLVPGKPERSMKLLVEVIGKAGGYLGLLNKIREGKSEERTLRKNISELKGESKAVVSMAKSKLSSIPSTIVKAIDITRNHGIKEIEKLRKDTIVDLSSIKKRATNSLRDVDERASNIEKKLDTCVETAMKNVTTCVEENMDAMDNHVKSSMNKFDGYMIEKKGEVEGWGNMREQLGEHDQKIKLAQVLFGIISDPDEILKLPRHMAAQLLKSLEVYVKEVDPSGSYTDLLFELRRDFF